MPHIRHIESGELISVQKDPEFVSGVWECGDQRFTDPNKDTYDVAPTPPKVSPVEFKLLFTNPERVAIKAARSTDPIIGDFYDIVEDPRLTFVDLGLQSTQDALSYMVATGLLSVERRAEILEGTVK